MGTKINYYIYFYFYTYKLLVQNWDEQDVIYLFKTF